MYKSLLYIGLTAFVIMYMTACQSSHPAPDLIGKWQMIDNWSTLEDDFVPTKESEEYEKFHSEQQEALKDFVFFFGKEYYGTMDKNGDTSNFYPYIIEEDSVLTRPDKSEYFSFIDKDTLLIRYGAEHKLFARRAK